MTSQHFRTLGLIVGLVAVLGLASVAAGDPLAGSTAGAADETKIALFKQVQDQVLRYSFFTVFDDINIALEDDGTVTLTGSVTLGHKKTDIEKRVAKLDGVTHVNNQIMLLPPSRRDDRIRYQVARAIYGNPRFWRYGTRANPPIHIVVNRGHVRLTGVVASEVDRSLARALAVQADAFSFSVTNELRLPDEVTAELEQLE